MSNNEALRPRIEKMLNSWLSEELDQPTHVALNMPSFVKLKNEYYDERGMTEEEAIMLPLDKWEGLNVVVSEDPEADDIVLLKTR